MTEPPNPVSVSFEDALLLRLFLPTLLRLLQEEPHQLPFPTEQSPFVESARHPVLTVAPRTVLRLRLLPLGNPTADNSRRLFLLAFFCLLIVEQQQR